MTSPNGGGRRLILPVRGRTTSLPRRMPSQHVLTGRGHDRCALTAAELVACPVGSDAGRSRRPGGGVAELCAHGDAVLRPLWRRGQLCVPRRPVTRAGGA